MLTTSVYWPPANRLFQFLLQLKIGHQISNLLQKINNIYYRKITENNSLIIISVCKTYAAEYDVMFNWNNSKLLFCRSSVMVQSEITVNGEIVDVSDKTVHLGHTVSTTDRDCITMAANNN